MSNKFTCLTCLTEHKGIRLFRRPQTAKRYKFPRFIIPSPTEKGYHG
ncbi:hypothetical protein HMPREF3156_02555 [Neisseria sp. HMSC06F02]|nr:hypothetical protein HMPREF3156_02555 [Neisseria sp. HMSC06F02]